MQLFTDLVIMQQSHPTSDNFFVAWTAEVVELALPLHVRAVSPTGRDIVNLEETLEARPSRLSLARTWASRVPVLAKRMILQMARPKTFDLTGVRPPLRSSIMAREFRGHRDEDHAIRIEAFLGRGLLEWSE